MTPHTPSDITRELAANLIDHLTSLGQRISDPENELLKAVARYLRVTRSLPLKQAYERARESARLKLSGVEAGRTITNSSNVSSSIGPLRPPLSVPSSAPPALSSHTPPPSSAPACPANPPAGKPDKP